MNIKNDFNLHVQEINLKIERKDYIWNTKFKFE